tara:strand:- start:304 stop:741 length:438 start_codon:yes stop_codon:yes gene_type:complete
MKSKEMPYVLYVAEIIYSKIFEIKSKNSDFSNVDAFDAFMGSDIYNKISSGKFHDEWFEKLTEDNFIDSKTKKKVPEETIRLLKIQKDMMVKQLIHYPDLYYAKSHFPLEISQRAFDHLWRMCESYELWCKETKQNKLIKLSIID